MLGITLDPKFAEWLDFTNHSLPETTEMMGRGGNHPRFALHFEGGQS